MFYILPRNSLQLSLFIHRNTAQMNIVFQFHHYVLFGRVASHYRSSNEKRSHLMYNANTTASWAEIVGYFAYMIWNNNNNHRGWAGVGDV